MNNKYIDLLDNTTDWFLEVDIKGNYTYSNKMNQFENPNNYTVQNLDNVKIELYNPNFNIAILDYTTIKY